MIISTWRKSGCWPINHDIFQDDEFAPSVTTSTSASHIPYSFPVSNAQEVGDDDSDDDSDCQPDVSDDLGMESHDDDAETTPGELIPTTMHPNSHGPPISTTGLPTILPALPIMAVIFQPIPPDKFYAPIHPSLAVHDYPCACQPSIQTQVNNLIETNQELLSCLVTLEAHCNMAGTEILSLKQCLNTKDKKMNKQWKLNVDTRWLNSDEGLQLAEEHRAMREAEQQKKQEAKDQCTAKETEQQHQSLLRDPNEPFTGTLASKMKPDLQEVADALGLSIEGQKQDLLE